VANLIFGSLFSGIGGLDLGLERAGMICKWQVEVDPFCQQVLAKHWPDVERFKDVRECGRHNLATVDLIAGGFPCQPHSVAGQQRGAEDDRNLWPEYRRIVAELRPTWVLAENVPGIRWTILDDILSDLEDLAYTPTTIDIPACSVGAWHKRHRFFIIAYTNSRRQQGESLSIRSGQSQKAALDTGGHCKNAHAEGQRLQNRRQTRTQTCQDETDWKMAQSRFERRCRSWWAIEPDVGRVVNGLSIGMERIRRKRIAALGNAVVPQVAEFVGRLIACAREEYNDR